MSRYGWSSAPERGQLSPFNSTLGHGSVPSVTDDDYEYITSEDLQNQGVDSQHAYDYETRRSNHHSIRPISGPALEIPDDDILKIRHDRVEYAEHFPAYSIGDGKLLVSDVRDRIQLLMKLSDRRTERIKMLYKGKLLKDDNQPVCKYGVKNNSEVMVVLPTSSTNGDSDSGEEVVVVATEDGASRPQPSNRDRKKKEPEPPATGLSATGVTPSATGVAGTIDKLNSISSHFTTTLLPLCVQFTAAPPPDRKKREDEHRRISETVMQQVILKLDEVETGGDEQARARRKDLVKQVQEVLKGLDARLKG